MHRLALQSISLLLLLAQLTWCNACAGGEDANPLNKGTKMLAKVVEICQQKDSFAAIEYVQAQGEPLEVAKAFAQLVQDLYYKQKNLPLMLMIGRAGVHFCLNEAQRCEGHDAELAGKLRGTAKMMSFNLAVNCWPAWDEEGIAITPTDQRIGHDLARLNLRLAEELKRPPDKVATAYWLLGAHQLAAEEVPEAIISFHKAAELFKQAKQPEGQHMALGYAGIAKTTVAETKLKGERALKAAVEQLREIDTDDSKFYADQLESVSKWFAKEQ